MDSSESAIRIENVWKVFGNTSTEALAAIQNQRISKKRSIREI
jgi:glycine betaine/proline transport system ATP-binding protein